MQPHEQLEHEWSQFNDLDPVGMVACSSGTAALHLVLEALRLPPGSKVIVPDFNMIAVPRAVTLAGMEPVFVDCGDDLNIDQVLASQTMATNDKTLAAVILVHIYGRKCDDEIVYDAKSEGLYVIEDLAEAHGVRPHPRTDAAAWSFYSNKIVSGAEGGAVWFRDHNHATLARQLRSLGFTEAHDFDHVPRGHNYRMSNIHAVLILKSLQQYGYNMFGHGGRKMIEAWYDKHCPQEWRMPPRDAPWVYDLRIKGMGRVDQNDVVNTLKVNDIAARHAFKPMSDQKEYKHCKMVAGDNINGTRSRLASREVVYLPITPRKTTEADCKRAFEIIKKSLES